MKKLILILFCFTPITILFAQEKSETGFEMPRTIIKISPLQFGLKTAELSLETFNKTYNKSFNVSVGFRSRWGSYNDGFGSSLEFGYRKYLSPMKNYSHGNCESYRGIYYNLFVRGEYYNGKIYYVNPETIIQKTYSISSGFTVGYQRKLWNTLVFDIYAGGGFRIRHTENLMGPEYYNLFDPRFSGFYPKIGVKIGFGL